MQFQHRSHSLIKRQHSSHIGRPLPLPSTSTRPRNTKGHNGSPGRPNTLMKAMQVETVPVRAHAYTSIHTQLPACNFVGLRNTHVPATQAVDTDPDCDWETWLEAGGDLLMGQPT